MLGMLCWLAAVPALMLLVSGSHAARGMVSGLALLAVVVTPFVAWNPQVLHQYRPSFWWPMHWPGWRAVFWVAMLSLLANSVYFALELLGSQQHSKVLTAVIMLIAELVDWSWPLAALGLWLARGRIATALAYLRRGLAHGLAGAYLWQGLLVFTVGALLAWPILVGAALRIFVVPQYQAWGEAAGLDLSTGLRLLSSGRLRMELLYSAALPLSLYLALVLGRLGWMHGLGGTQPPRLLENPVS